MKTTRITSSLALSIFAGLIATSVHIWGSPGSAAAATAGEIPNLPVDAANGSIFLWELLLKGGYTMIPLGLCSLIAVAIVIERLVWGPSRKRLFPVDLQLEIRALLSQGRIEELLGLCRGRESALARLTSVALEHGGRPRGEIIELLESAGKRESVVLQRRLGTLGTIAAISPLLGLLGTVIGIIVSFQVIGSVGVGDPKALAGGIAEALITTAAGLIIAIPAVAFHRMFIEQTRRLIVEMETFALEVLDRVMLLSNGAAPIVAHPSTPAERDAALARRDPLDAELPEGAQRRR